MEEHIEPSQQEERPQAGGEQQEAPREPQARDEHSAADATLELMRLVELPTKYPEIGPPLAELAFKIGEAEIANRIVRMGLEAGTRGLEYYFVAANVARREGRAQDVLEMALAAVRTYAGVEDAQLAGDDGSRLLHLVRLAFATLLFDVKDPAADRGFVDALKVELPKLESRMGSDPFYRSLTAQTLWYEDKEKSEQEWQRAVEIGDDDLAWNARGTWYKEAEHDLAKAADAYRQGLAKVPRSALLRHNLAQVLIDQSERITDDGDAKRRLLREADDLLRASLREDAPKGLRRHIHATRDRLSTLRAQLPPRATASHGGQSPAPEPEPLPQVGDVVHGRVVSLTAYGAFVSLAGRGVGLLHKSELAHAPVGDPAAVLKVGDDVEVKVLDVEVKEGARPRIGLSRKALLPAPPEATQPQGAAGEARQTGARPHGERGRERSARGGGARGRRGGRGEERRDHGDPGRGRARSGEGDRGRREGPNKALDTKLASLGEMLLAKMREQEQKS